MNGNPFLDCKTQSGASKQARTISNVMKLFSAFPGFAFILISSLLLSACTPAAEEAEPYDRAADVLRFEGENHFQNIRQLTFGGNNAEAYWSFDDSKLVFQSDWNAINDQGCDQIYVMDVSEAGSGSVEDYTEVSTGEGRTTCSYFLPDGRVIYGSTHEADAACPTPVAYEMDRYVWPIYPTYDIYVADADGSNPEVLIGGDGYDTEATVSPDGKWIIFTSTRSGDLELWRYEIETGELLQLTDELGYDGGAFFSPDSQKIVWRASRPTGEAAVAYRDLLDNDVVEPSQLNIFIADIDGSNVQQITDLPGANWAPFFHPSGEKILFTTNHHQDNGRGRIFDIFMINLDGTGLEQITHSGTFDGFPMFSNDGTKIAFASNRNVEGVESRDTNVFVADWVD
jgi:Tol biopolymer transport system component